MSGVVTIESESQFNEILSNSGSKLVVVDFYADWCGPCRMIAPKVQAMTEQFLDVVFVKVNVDNFAELSGKYGVQGIPHFVFIKNSQKVDEFSGANESKLRETVARLK